MGPTTVHLTNRISQGKISYYFEGSVRPQFLGCEYDPRNRLWTGQPSKEGRTGERQETKSPDSNQNTMQETSCCINGLNIVNICKIFLIF